MTPEERKSYNKQYNLDNREKRNAYSKQYRIDNREYFIKTRLDNKKKLDEHRRLYRLSKKGIIVVALNSAKHRAKKFNREFNITKEYIASIYPKNGLCPIKNILMTPKQNGITGGSNDSPSLDRVDNSKGYIVGNCQWISQSANTEKGNK